MTYTLTLLNVGSLATGLTITDRVPGTVSYTRGGAYSSGVVSWSLPRLNTGKSAEFTYTVYISDVMGIAIVNDDYAARCAEGVRQPGDVLTSVVFGPLDPIAKKPGGGGGPVTPTLVVHNTGPGNAIDATAVLEFGNISVSQGGDLRTIPPSTWPFPRATCLGDEYDKCYSWIGDLMYGETITFTTYDPQSTSGGEEGTTVTATVVITDGLSNVDTTPVTGTGIAKVTHLAYLNVHKSAPKVIGRGQVMTYTINIWNSALATDPPNPYLWDFMPISGTTVITSSISHGGTIQSVLTGSLQATVISWTLPALGTGERIEPRSFAVRVDGDLVSGTQIINDYRVGWYENDPTYVGWRENDGQPFTTTVVEVGLIDSFKVVTPELALPGPGNVLTYYLHIVNSSPLSLTGVTVYDYLPWQSSTYYRDAVASAGQVVSDIISVRWTGDVDAFSSEVVTLTVLVDADYKGPVTNTAVISHPGLLDDVVVEAVAYITDEPVLAISKRASPSPVSRGGELLYTIRVRNLGQQATGLVITDAVPANTTYITGSATSGGQLVGDVVRWENIHVIDPGGSRSFGFRVAVERGSEIVNDRYVVRCQEGVIDVGDPVITRVMGGGNRIYLPLIVRNL
jgi:uncharacterized repeat protein (TIGR01451 family)